MERRISKSKSRGIKKSRRRGITMFGFRSRKRYRLWDTFSPTRSRFRRIWRGNWVSAFGKSSPMMLIRDSRTSRRPKCTCAISYWLLSHLFYLYTLCIHSVHSSVHSVIFFIRGSGWKTVTGLWKCKIVAKYFHIRCTKYFMNDSRKMHEAACFPIFFFFLDFYLYIHHFSISCLFVFIFTNRQVVIISFTLILHFFCSSDTHRSIDSCFTFGWVFHSVIRMLARHLVA